MSRFTLPIETPSGVFHACYSEKGLAELSFPERNASCTEAALVPEVVRDWHRLTSRAVKAALKGQLTNDLPPLDLVGTEFQKAVWAALKAIPLGKTLTYGEVAVKIGNPKATRAIGMACGANPIPILIPCHRVVAASSKIGGFSGGLHWKRQLLAAEGVLLSL